MAGELADWTAAEELVANLVETAIWSEQECTWIGREQRDSWRSSRVVYATLGPELYSGTSGVALALAWAALKLDDHGAERTAIAAMRHSLRLGARMSGPHLDGFYSGRPGIAFAAYVVGQLVGDPVLGARGRDLAGLSPSGTDCPDLVLGTAGALLARALLPWDIDSPPAQALVSSLAASVQPAGGWKNAPIKSSRPLTGLSHGASGEAFALLEWHGKSHDQLSLGLAKGALAYEGRLLAPDERNWPDFRILPDLPRGGTRYGSSWCHGGPGIGLVHAYALREFGIGGPALVETAAATTRGYVQSAVDHGVAGSLCHGLAGNAEILSELAEYGQTADGPDLLERAAAEVRRHLADVDDEDTPALMVGRAGLLHFFLRRLDPAVPSILLPEARRWHAALAGFS